MTSKCKEKFITNPPDLLSGVRYIVAVASGKGGVGKSTVASNLALGVSKFGSKVAILDCDIYGPSIPLMFGLLNSSVKMNAEQKMFPLESHGVKLMSLGFVSNDQTPIIWRGPMVHQILIQFLSSIVWGDLDYLFLDLPPGTGDAQLTITQSIRLSGAVIVTTPQEVSLIDARKALKMFQKVNVPVLGLIENMSYFICPDCAKTSEIFKRGGGRRISEELQVPFLGEIPIDSEVVKSGDEGTPIVAKQPDSVVSKRYSEIGIAIGIQLKVMERNRHRDKNDLVQIEMKKNK